MYFRSVSSLKTSESTAHMFRDCTFAVFPRSAYRDRRTQAPQVKFAPGTGWLLRRMGRAGRRGTKGPEGGQELTSLYLELTS